MQFVPLGGSESQMAKLVSQLRDAGVGPTSSAAAAGAASAAAGFYYAYVDVAGSDPMKQRWNRDVDALIDSESFRAFCGERVKLQVVPPVIGAPGGASTTFSDTNKQSLRIVISSGD